MADERDLGGPCVVATGGPATGKTRLVLDRAAALLAAGVAAEDVLLVAPSPWEADELRGRAARALGSRALDGRVTWAGALAEAIVGEPSGARACGRGGRVLSDFETRLLMEDLKTVGGKRSRNREIVKFLLKGLSELRDAEDGFIVSGEELLLLNGMRERLALRGGIVRHELSGLAVAALRADPELAARHRVRFVLVDDAQNLCRASQLLVEELAGEQLVAVGDAGHAVETYEPYPYAEGLAELAERRGVVPFELEPDRSDWAGASAQAYPTPDEEIAGVAAELAGLSAAERAEALAVVPNAVWANRLVRELAARGVACSCLLGGEGRVRGARSAARERALALLGIACDERDGVAWRSYVGCAMGLWGVGAWDELEKYAKQRGLTAAKALASLADRPDRAARDEVPHAGPLASIYAEGLAQAARVRAAWGNAVAAELVDACGVTLREAGLADVALLDGEGCDRLAAKVREQVFAPRFEAGALRVAAPTVAAGCSATRVWLLGAVEGHYPTAAAVDPVETLDHRAYYTARDERTFYAAVGRPAGGLRLSWPEAERAEDAAKTGARMGRIYVDGGERMARLVPSRFALACVQDGLGA